MTNKIDNICLFQLLACQNRMLELEKEVENPYNDKRARFLEGKDPPPADLHEKVEDVSCLSGTRVFIALYYTFIALKA